MKLTNMIRATNTLVHNPTTFPMAFKFTIDGFENSNGIKIPTLSGKIKSIRQNILPVPELENIEYYEKELADWALRHKILEKDGRSFHKFKNKCATLAACLSPNLKFDNSSLRSLTYITSIYFILDDIIDNSYVNNNNILNKLTTDKLKEVIESFVSLFKTDKKDHKYYHTPSDFPLYTELCNSIIDFTEYNWKNITNYNLKYKDFFIDNENYLKSYVMERELKSNNKKLSKSQYQFMRYHSSAGELMLELSALINEIYLSKEIRNNFIFKKFKQTAVIFLLLQMIYFLWLKK